MGTTDEALQSLVTNELARQEAAAGRHATPVVPASDFPDKAFIPTRRQIEEDTINEYIRTQNIDIFSPRGAQLVEEKAEEVREATRAPRTPSGERATDFTLDPLTKLVASVAGTPETTPTATPEETIQASLAQGKSGITRVLKALQPQVIEDEEVYAASVRKFDEDITEYYNDYLNKVESGDIKPPPGISQSDLLNKAATKEGHEEFRRIMKEAGGERGEWLVRDNQDRVLWGAATLADLSLTDRMFREEEALEVRESLFGTFLRDLLLAESAATAGGQEILSRWSDEVVGDKEYFTRWAENLSKGRGVEVLTSDAVETAFLESGATADVAQEAADTAWYIGLAGSMFLPLDMGIATAGGKVAQKARYLGLFGEVSRASEMAKRAGLDIRDIRLQLASDMGRTKTSRETVEKFIKGEDLTTAQRETLERGGYKIEPMEVLEPGYDDAIATLPASANEARRTMVKTAAKRVLGYLGEGGKPEVRDFLERAAEAVIDPHGDALVISDAFGDNVLAPGEALTRSEIEALELITDEASADLAAHTVKRLVEEGKGILPANLVMLTSRIALPKKAVKEVIKNVRNSTIGKTLADLPGTEAARSVFAGSDAIPSIIKQLRAQDIPEMGVAIGRLEELHGKADPGRVIRMATDLLIEAEARRLFPNAAIDIAELETMATGAVAKGGTIPLHRVDKGGVSKAARISRENLGRIEDLLTPEELRRSRVGKALARTKDYYSGQTHTPFYKIQLRKLSSRLSQLNDEVMLGVEKHAGKGKPYLIAVGEYLQKDFGWTPQELTKRLVYAGYGVVDDVGTAFSGASGKQGNTIFTNQAKVGEVLDRAMSKEGGLLWHIMQKMGKFDTFTPEFFEELNGFVYALQGRTLNDLSDWGQFAGKDILVDNRFRLKGDNQPENLTNTIVMGAREKVLRDFSEEILDTMPESFMRSDEVVDNIVKIAGTKPAISNNIIDNVVGPYHLDDVAKAEVKTLAENKLEVLLQDEASIVDLIGAAFMDRMLIWMGSGPAVVKERIKDIASELPPGALGGGRLNTLAESAAEAHIFSTAEYNIIFDEVWGSRMGRGVSGRVLFNHLVAFLDVLHSKPAKKVGLDKTPGGMDAARHRRFIESEMLHKLDTEMPSKPVRGSPIEEAYAVPVNLLDPTASLSKEAKEVFTTNQGAVLRFQLAGDEFASNANKIGSQVDEALPRIQGELPAGQKILSDEEFNSLIETLTERMKKLPDNEAGALVGAKLSKFIPNIAYGGVKRVANLTKNGVLGGAWLIPNVTYHTINLLSAPLIELSTLGIRGAIEGMRPDSLYSASRVILNLYGYRLGLYGYGRSAISPEKVLVTTPSGKRYTNNELADIVRKNGITASEASIELRTDMYADLVTWTGRNWKQAGVTPKGMAAGRAFFKAIGTEGRTPWSEFANATDNLFRTSVLVSALKRGATEDQALALAREALFDYGAIPPVLKNKLNHIFWLYSFRFLNDVKVIDNAINHPTRLLQGYKAQRGFFYDDGENDTYFPLMSKYNKDRMWLGVYEDKDTKRRYALLGPQVPMIDAFEEIVEAGKAFARIGNAALNKDPWGAAETSAIETVSLAVDVTHPLVEYLTLNISGYEKIFGDIDEAGGYISPGFIQFLINSGQWESFKTIYNIQPVEPRGGRPTWDGYEYRVHPKDKVAKRNLLLFRKRMLLAGVERSSRDYSGLVIDDKGRPTMGLGTEALFGSKAGRMEVIPSRSDIEREALYDITSEIKE